MTTRTSLLSQISIPSPCPVHWSELIGEGRERFCEQCDKRVYDFSTMTVTEVVALLSTTRGRVCARITRQTDGTVLTEEPLPLLPVVRRRASPFANVAVTTLIAITSAPAGPPIAKAAMVVQTKPAKGTQVPVQTALPGHITASISGTVSDQSQAVVAGARVLLTNHSSSEIRVVTTSEEGVFGFSGLAAGTFTVVVESPGFATTTVQEIKVASREERRINVTLEVGAISGDVVSLPRPLRILYDQSDLIVVVRIGESETVRNERSARRIKTNLRVLSVLKGSSPAQTIDLYHWGFANLTGPFVAGDELLLFLNRSTTEPGQESNGKYEIGDTGYGVKKVTGDELAAYRDRIAELSQIYQGNGPVDISVVEWLVRCAENQATRWEGSYELVNSIDRSLNQRANEDSKTGPPFSSGDNAKPFDNRDLHAASREGDVSALITAEQKARLMTALLQIEELRDRDLPLIALAQRWKEPRLVAFLIGQLHKIEARPPRLAERVLDILASELNDEAIATLAGDYQTKVSYLDETGETPNDPAQTASVARGEKAAAAMQTRSELLAAFLRVVEAALAERPLK